MNMTKNQRTLINKYYFYQEASNILYYSDYFSDDPNHIYMGTSNNPNVKMAAAIFMKSGNKKTGFVLRELK